MGFRLRVVRVRRGGYPTVSRLPLANARPLGERQTMLANRLSNPYVRANRHLRQTREIGGPLAALTLRRKPFTVNMLAKVGWVVFVRAVAR